MASSMAAGAPRSVRRAERTGWYGWIVFAGTMMLMLGSFHAVAGLVALFKDQYYLVGKSGLVVNVDYTTWGWTHLIFCVIVAAAGVALYVGAMWAREPRVPVGVPGVVGDHDRPGHPGDLRRDRAWRRRV